MSEKIVTMEELKMLVAKIGDRLPDVATVAMTASAQAMVRDVVLNRMSELSPGRGNKLGVITGAARRSITSDVSKSPTSIVARFGSSLKYVRAHELGFHGAVQVRAHQRRRRKALEVGNKGTVTRASARRYKETKGKQMSYVRAHSRQVRMRARRFLRDTLLQEAGRLPGLLQGFGDPPYAQRLIRAMRIYVEQNRMPIAGELGT